MLNVRTAGRCRHRGRSSSAPCASSIHRCRSTTSAELADHTKAATFQQKLAGDLLVVFGALALALAGIGSYGVLSYLVGLRRREIGIRLAVGATRGDVFRLIAGSGARLIALGVVVGLLLSIGVGMGLQSMLIGIKPSDPITYAGVIGILDHCRRRGVPDSPPAAPPRSIR